MLLKAEHLCKAYRRRAVVRDVSIALDCGEIVGLLGPNGAGKTTTFNMIAGLVLPDQGSVMLLERDLARLPLFERARLGLGYLAQEATIFRGLSVIDNFLAVLENRPLTRSERQNKATELLARYRLEHVKNSLGSELSGGERRRVEMARALIMEPKVILLDEPFAGIDPIAIHEIRVFIMEMRQAGIGVILTDHNVRETLSICDRAYILSEGKILVAGTPEEIVAHPEARKAYLGENFSL